MKAHRGLSLTVLGLLALGVLGGGQSLWANEPPVAEAGLSRYVAQDPIRLDGSGSYDPDNSGPLTYTWTQVSGPLLVVTGATTATPTISGFVQTTQVQECQFQLLVHDGQQASSSDIVTVVIVPSFGPSTLHLANGPFDSNKPTIIFFSGSMDGVNGGAGGVWSADPAWSGRANLIDFPSGYTPDSGYTPAGGTATRTYYKYGDMILVYLSAVAPDYRQAIQVIGFSSGVDIALNVGIRMNETYRDARYAVNRVTALDGGVIRLLEGGASLSASEALARLGSLSRANVDMVAGWDAFLTPFHRFLASAVDTEQCWIDFYSGTMWFPRFEPPPHSNVLWVRTGMDHFSVYNWYINSLTGSDMNQFNDGLVGGAYWSVIGPGKNLQLASAPGTYYFAWTGGATIGAMSFLDPSEYPGRLPEPIALVDFRDPSIPGDDPNSVILTCEESQNAVGYQLLCGCDPYDDVGHYTIVADSNSPPAVPVGELPASAAWWTIRARDAYGSTIHANPLRIFRGLIRKVVATASSAQPFMGPEKTVDGSGLDERDGHSTDNTDMWQSANVVGPHWIQYQFDQVYALHELWVWNSNQKIEPFLGFGARTVKIEYSPDGAMWTALANVPEIARASGQPGYVHNTTISLGGVSAQYVKLTIEKGWGPAPSVGLSEVRFFYIPDRTWATTP